MSEINVAILSCSVANDPRVVDIPGGGRVFQCRVVGAGLPYRDGEGRRQRHPVFIEVKAWNRGNGKLADLCGERLRRGSRCIIHGVLMLDEWQSADGRQNSRIVLDVQEVEFLD